MGCKKFVTFDFVEGNYILKMTKENQAKDLVKVKIGISKDSNIVYRNEMNTIKFPNFSAMDFNLFFTICYFGIKRNYKRKTLRGVKIKFSDLRIFLPQIKNKKRFFDEIAKFVKYKLKLVGVDSIEYDEMAQEDGTMKDLDNGKRKLKGAVFIKNYILDEEKEELYLEFTPYAYSMLNEFGNFMSFDMNEFCSFENKYTKSLFRLLKQYENSNFYADKENPSIKAISMTKGEFIKFMDTPSNYKMSQLDCFVVIPSLKELNGKSSSFKNLTYEKLYTWNNERKKVTGFQFVFEKRTIKN